MFAFLILSPFFSFFAYPQGPDFDQWRNKDEAENYTPRHECSVVQAGNRFYLMGGRENAKTIDVYDYTANIWTQIPDSPPEEFNHFQATEYKGLIWVIGAFKTNAFPNETPADYIWAFDPVKEEWIQGPEIPNNRKRGSAGLVVYNDKLYIAGGNTRGHNGGYVNWFDEYDPATGNWTPLANAPRARDHFHAGLIGNKMYLAGGRLSGGQGGTFRPTIAEVDVYDFTTGTWSTLPANQNLPTPRGAPAVANFNDKLVVIGGEVENQQVYGETVDDALKITEQYDPDTQQWTRLPDLNSERHGTQAIVSGNGIFVLAGSPNRGGGNQKNMEYLGEDNPVGLPNTASTLVAPDAVDLEPGASTDFTLRVTGGNMGMFIRSMALTGAGATNFSLTSGRLENAFLDPESSHSITVSLTGSGQNTNAVLTIAYGASSELDILLKNGEPSAGINNPGIQYNKEGDAVSVPIQGNDNSSAFTFSATGLPPNLTINATTGLISGTVGGGNSNDGAAANSPYQVKVTATENTNATNSSTVEFTWIIDNSGNPMARAEATPLTGQAPLNVTFTGSGSADDKGIAEYQWDFGDALTSSSNLADPSFTFTESGTFNVKLTVTDVDGNTDSESLEIVVDPKPVYTIEATAGENGSISPNGEIEVVEGADQVFTITPNEGYAITEVSVDGISQGAIDTFTFNEVNAPHTIEAIFRLIADAEYAITATATIGGTLSPNGSIAVTEGGTQSFSIVADTGFEIADIKVDGTSIANADSYTFANVVEDHSLEIVFTELTVDGNEAPKAEAVSDATQGTAPFTVNFDGTDSSDDESIVSYEWNFGDGSPEASGASVEHTFNEPGEYTVWLTVADREGKTSTVSVMITVSAPSETGNGFRIFPNPASVVVNLGLDEEIELQNIYIYNIEGRLMRSLDAKYVKFGGEYRINVSLLSEGLYFIGSQDADGKKYHSPMLIKR